jgi:hypothetical protein
MQTSELMCLGAGAAALSLLLCRQSGPGAYRAGSECSAYRAEVTAEESDAASARRITTSAPLFGDDPPPASWEATPARTSWRDAYAFAAADAPPAKADARPPIPSRPLPAAPETTNSRTVGHKTATESLKEHLVYGPQDVDAPPPEVFAPAPQPVAHS